MLTDNFYASPEAVEQVDSDELREYRRTLGRLARGLMWVMLSFVAAVGAALVTEAFLRNYLAAWVDVAGIVFIGAFCGLQLLGAVYCWLGAEGFVENGRLLIAASGVLSVVMLFFGYMTKIGPPILAMLAFGFSCWCWQVFLLRLARKVESLWLTWNAWLVIATFSVAGFATLAVFGIDKFGPPVIHYQPTPLQEFLNVCQSVGVGIAMISGFAYFGLYAIVLIGLWKRLWTLVARAWEGEGGNEE